jgi:Polyketide cyclase / dehydrase and lipid transport
MPTIRAHAEGLVLPEQVVAVLTDFSEARLERWPNLRGRFDLHARGEGWAEVTEGSTVLGRAVRERGRYAWDDTHVRLTIDTSDIRKAGSTWDYRVVPDGHGGCRVDFALDHRPKGVLGWLLAGVLPLAGRRFFGRSLEGLLRSLR